MYASTKTTNGMQIVNVMNNMAKNNFNRIKYYFLENNKKFM